MFRLWIKQWKDNRLIQDTVVEDDSVDTRTHKVLRALEEGCRQFDLAGFLHQRFSEACQVQVYAGRVY